VNFVDPFTSQAMFLLGQGLVSPNLGQRIGIPGSWSVLIPALLVGGAIAFVLLQALRARASVGFGPIALGAVVLGVAAMLLSGAYPPMPEPVTMYFEARVLKLVDQPRLAGSWFEQAVARAPDQNVRRQVADRAFPEAAAVYAKLGDGASLARIRATWTNLDPASPKLRELEQALQGGAPSR
jgi:hypothetical protein